MQIKLLSLEFSGPHSSRPAPSKPPAIPLNDGLPLLATLFPLLNAYSFFKNTRTVDAGTVWVLYTYILISNPPTNPMGLEEFAEDHAADG